VVRVLERVLETVHRLFIDSDPLKSSQAAGGGASKGFNSRTLNASKSATLRVTIVRSWLSAVAAIRDGPRWASYR
jgi:hypothetical protein